MTFMLLAAIATLFAGCYGNHHDGRLPSVSADVEADSTCFYETHHYGQNFNFVVKVDSLMLVRQQPVEILSRMHTDTIEGGTRPGNIRMVARVVTVAVCCA